MVLDGLPSPPQHTGAAGLAGRMLPLTAQRLPKTKDRAPPRPASPGPRCLEQSPQTASAPRATTPPLARHLECIRRFTSNCDSGSLIFVGFLTFKITAAGMLKSSCRYIMYYLKGA